MANSLLDFVMALVRDPEAAARYQADPGQAIADANLAGVSSADVDNLIPVVSESLSSAVPTGGFESVADSNVWSSGEATAAFDAFAAPVLDQPADEGFAIVTDLVSDPLAGAIVEPVDTAVPSMLDEAMSLQAPAPETVDFAVDSAVETAAQSGIWTADDVVPHVPSGFDIFE